jgi:hypothetical protein
VKESKEVGAREKKTIPFMKRNYIIFNEKFSLKQIKIKIYTILWLTKNKFG